LNQSETAVIQQSFSGDEFSVVAFDEPADIAIINTCTVTDNGDSDCRRLVNKAIRANPDVKIALIGCQAQTQKEKLLAWPNVRWVVGNQRKMDLASVLKEFDQLEPALVTPAITREAFTIDHPGIDAEHTRANIKIQDGCDFFCSFCEIPYARGRARSRVFSDILNECRKLAAAGYKEIILTGINIGTYSFEKYTMLDVINAIEQIEGLERIRISSIEPTTVAYPLIEKMAGTTKLCRYLHIPLQSGDDDVLKAMERKYDSSAFFGFIRRAQRAVPEICIGTDVIVGFPGETEAQFNNTYERLLEGPVHYFHVFSYSDRYLAKARNFTDKVPSHVISKRSERLRDLSQRKRRVYHESLLGTPQKVLFEEQKDGYWTGLTDHYVRTFVKAGEDLSNQLRDVKFNHIHKAGVEGEIVK